MNNVFSLLVSISVLFCQEPPPIKSGVAPKQNEYTNDYDVISYDLEIGLGIETEEIEGNTNITLILKKRIDNISLDFTGLSIHSITINNSIANYRYK